jgi:hypothetical protein
MQPAPRLLRRLRQEWRARRRAGAVDWGLLLLAGLLLGYGLARGLQRILGLAGGF